MLSIERFVPNFKDTLIHIKEIPNYENDLIGFFLLNKHDFSSSIKIHEISNE